MIYVFRIGMTRCMKRECRHIDLIHFIKCVATLICISSQALDSIENAPKMRIVSATTNDVSVRVVSTCFGRNGVLGR